MVKKVDYSVMSHSERIKRSNELNRVPKGLYDGLVEKVYVETFKTDDEGRTVKTVELKTVKVADKNQGLTIHDFSIGNLQAIGAVDSLKFSQLAGDMNIVDKSLANADRLMDELDKIDLAQSVENVENISE